MELQLENLQYQNDAIESIVKVFDGNQRNIFDNSNEDGIRFNFLSLKPAQISENIQKVINENGLSSETANLSDENDLCVEMETGTGKTLVYLKTIYELYKHYGFTKFIILVPSVAIREGVISTFDAFEKQLDSIYAFTPKLFEYDSKKLNKVTNFIEDQHPQIMVITLASFNSEDKILNQAQREDLFANIPFIDAIGKTRPIIIMDEPQEGMDTDNSIGQISKLHPLCKIRYSATHKVKRNLVYRLTPYDSYKQGLVKKIEVLTVSEINDEATIKIEFSRAQNGKGEPKAKLKAWKVSGNGINFGETNWLKVGDNLGEKTKNPSYNNYELTRINKSLTNGKWYVEFSNGVKLEEKALSGNLERIWELQLEWLIRRHFLKTRKLSEKGIKCLSLIFIDRVANYMGESPIIKNLFVEKYKTIYKEFNDNNEPSPEHVNSIQGYYFAQKSSGEYADNEGGQKEQKRIYDLILRGKEELLGLNNPVQFIFSHSALGVGWDNPNIFNIATLNNAFSEIRKRQEIGRGLRICVDQDGYRIYDKSDVKEEERLNQLTVIPNETYETFVTQYQQEIESIYGSTSAGATLSHNHKGLPQNTIEFKLNKKNEVEKAFKKFWNALAKKTDYIVFFNEEELIGNSISKINEIKISDYSITVGSRTIEEISESGIVGEYGGSDVYKAQPKFSPLDLVEELSENTGLSYSTIFKILNGIANHKEIIKNPPLFIHLAGLIIKNVELEEMIRGLEYKLNGESFSFSFEDFIKNISDDAYVNTPNKGVFDKMLIDSNLEKGFAEKADTDDEVVCFLKLPSYYKINTPIGDYEPDFGLVMKRRSLTDGNENEYYFVIEIKGTNDINDKKALTESELYKIKCAFKHFKAIGLEVHFKAPVKEYSYFKTEANNTINSLIKAE